MKILYISDIFGNMSGAPKSAIDVLISLLSTNHKVIVLSYSSKKSVLESIDRKSFDSLKWIKLPQNIPFPNQMNRRFFRNIAKCVIGGLQDLFIKSYKNNLKGIDADLIIINDIGSQGDGIARMYGFMIFVPGSKIGERVTVKIVSVGGKFAVSKPQELKQELKQEESK